jgi:hypothetical protein
VPDDFAAGPLALGDHPAAGVVFALGRRVQPLKRFGLVA